jgi:phosphate transport system permease protein
MIWVDGLSKSVCDTDEAYSDTDDIDSEERTLSTRLQGVKNSILCFIQELRTSKGAGRIDLLGRMGLIIPALASVAAITVILTLLWVEAAPILLNPEYGPGIIIDPTWQKEAGSFGIFTFIAGTFMCSGLAIIMAVPIGVAGAIFLCEFCPNFLKTPLRMILELMASIPSVVYGLWAFLVLKGWVDDLGSALLFDTRQGFSLLAGSIVLAIMLLPTIVTISNDALRSVPRTYREASYALGATKNETARRIVLSAALPGVGAAIILSLGRAVGETMAVLMVTGNVPIIPLTVFDPCFVMTSIIAIDLGTAYTEAVWRSALFAVALVLLLMSVLFTIIARKIVSWGMKTRGMS